MTSVALVVLDTLRKDAFDECFDWLPGTRFERAYAPGHCTPPVHASLFTGLYPDEHGVYLEEDELRTEERTVAEILSDCGYSTRAYCANPLVTPDFMFGRGFDEFRLSWDLRQAKSQERFNWSSATDNDRSGAAARYAEAFVRMLESDADTLRSTRDGVRQLLGNQGWGLYRDDGATEALSFVRSLDVTQDDDEFLFMNLMEAHRPYRPPPSYRTVSEYEYPHSIEMSFRDLNIDGENIRKAYHDSVSYLSDSYQEIFNVLKQKYELIITCGDHGELFGGQECDGLWEHFHGVYPELVHVPLSIYGPENDGMERMTPVSLVDVFPTITRAARVNETRSGRDLLGDIDPRPLRTHTHGISQMHLEKIRNDASATKRAKEFDQPFDGVVLPPSFYRYESVSGVHQDGTAERDDTEAAFKETLASISFLERTDSRSVDEAIVNRLERLGYR